MTTFRRGIVEAITEPGWWRDGDPVGMRQFLSVPGFETESGVELSDITVAYETWGKLSPAGDNAVLVLHALTGDSHVIGQAGGGHRTPGWWQGLVGPGQAIDTDKYFVVAPNVLGGCQGTTGPSSAHPADGRPWGSRFPRLTVRDQVRMEARFAHALGISAWNIVIGGSMGGMRALEWAIMYPERVRHLIALATTAQATADQIAWCSPQLTAIRHDPEFYGGDYYGYGAGVGPLRGLGVARQIAHTTYRAAVELNSRFGQDAQIGEDTLRDGRFAVESYLEYHAGKLARRFDANSYIALTEAMNSHDVGRGRGSVEEALALVCAKTLVVGIDSDRMFDVDQNWQIAAGIADAEFHVLHSEHGHDGFLVEEEAVGELVGKFLNSAKEHGSIDEES